MRPGKVELKRVPSPYEQDHPQAELLKRKGLSVWVDFEDTKMVTGKNIIKKCTASFKQIKPVFNRLSEF